MQAILSAPTRTYIRKLLMLSVLYAAVAHLSLYLVPPGPEGPSVVWPPAALGVAALVLYGYELWPGIILPFFLLLLMRGLEPPLAAGVALGNTLEALVCSFILVRYVGFSPLMARLRDGVGLVGAAFVGAFAGAAIIVGSVYLFTGGATQQLFMGLWVGHTVSVLTLAPFMLRWFVRVRFTKTRTEIIEGIIGFGIFAALAVLLFWTPYTSFGGVSFVYLLVLPLIWAALRTGPRGMALALALLAIISTTGVLFGWGPVTDSVSTQTLFFLQVLVGTLAMIFLLFTCIVEERKETMKSLEYHVNRLEQALQKIRSEDQAKTDFLAILAHELRNPLSPIVSSLELIKARGAEAATPAIVEVMENHVQTVSRLLDDLLDVSRISRKKFKLQKEPVLLQTAVARSLQTTDAFMKARGHTLEVSLPEEELWLDADPVRLEQMLVNLLNNAAKYTERGGTIALNVERRAGSVAIEVKDSGIGIEPHMLERIFEPFTQADGARRPGGLGIGLSLTKKLVELHHGTIAARSDGPGTGSSFVVILPLPHSMQLPLPEGRRPRGRFGKARREVVPSAHYRILVVDDNKDAARGLGTLLELHGHTVTLAYSGEGALAAARDVNPEIIVLDIGLPDADGYELARTLRVQRGTSVTLIAVTGYGQEDDRRRAKEAGFALHLTKPVSINDLEAALEKLRAHD